MKVKKVVAGRGPGNRRTREPEPIWKPNHDPHPEVTTMTLTINDTTMTSDQNPPDPAISGPASAGPARWTSDTLISIGDISELFKLGRTAAYELTQRPDFPEPVPISPRCHRWWA